MLAEPAAPRRSESKVNADLKNESRDSLLRAEPKPAPEPVPSHVRRNRRLIWTFVAVVAIGLIALAKPAYRFANGARARWLAGSALKLAEKRDLDKAILQAHAAYQLKPDEPVALRTMARVLALRHDPNAVRFWQQIAKSPFGTMDDRRSFVESALEQRLIVPAAEETRFLLAKEPASALNQLLAAKLNALAGDMPASLACAKRAHELDASNEEATLFLASVLLSSPDSHQEGLRLLWTIMDGNSRASLAAVVLAGRQPDLSAAEQERVIARLNNHPLATHADRLLKLEIELRKPAQRDALLARALAESRAAGDEAFRQFAVWLNTHGEQARTLDAIPLELALSRKDLFLIYLDALASLKKWSDVGAILAKGGLPLEETYVELYKWRAAAEIGQNDEADKHWRAAQIAATKSAGLGNPEQAIYLASYVERLGQSAKAEGIYRSLLGSPLTARPACEALLRIAVSKGTKPTRDLLREMKARWPDDVPVQNDYAYLQLLLGEEIDASRETAAALAAKFPNSLPHSTTLALAYLRSNNPAAAMEVFDRLPVAWEKAPAPSAAVYAAVLNANGRTDDARKLAAKIPNSSLRPEERALIAF